MSARFFHEVHRDQAQILGHSYVDQLLDFFSTKCKDQGFSAETKMCLLLNP